MQPRDRTINMLFFALASVAWLAVAQLVTTTPPRDSPTTGLVGAGLIGMACGLTSIPVMWLIPFGRHRRIALLGDWGRAMRRGGWLAAVVAMFVALRVQGVLNVPIAIFVIVLVLLAEIMLSMER
jgi:hypothetical protein